MDHVTRIEESAAAEQLTVGEQKVLAAWNEVIGPVDAEKDIDMIRQEMKFSAYRVAAHAAVNTFFGEHYCHSEIISIIPNKQYKSIFEKLNVSNSIYFRRDGIIMIMEDVSERVAESRFNDNVSLFSEEIMNVLENKTYGIEDKNYTEWLTPQVNKALRIAMAISNDIWTPFLILNMAEKWTNEVLDIPAVWGVVETLAQKLLDVGEIKDTDENVYHSIVKPIACASIYFPVWENRLWHKNIVEINVDHLSRTERKKLHNKLSKIPCLMEG